MVSFEYLWCFVSKYEKRETTIYSYVLILFQMTPVKWWVKKRFVSSMNVLNDLWNLLKKELYFNFNVFIVNSFCNVAKIGLFVYLLSAFLELFTISSNLFFMINAIFEECQCLEICLVFVWGYCLSKCD